jgi:hypothetical protein
MTSVIAVDRILPNVNTVVKKRLDAILHEARNGDSTQPKSERKWSADISPNSAAPLDLPAQNNLFIANHVPLLEFQNGRALSIIPGLSFGSISLQHPFHDPFAFSVCRSTGVSIGGRPRCPGWILL